MLLLFDIDGTLLQRASDEHARAVREAVAQVHGVELAGVRLRESAAGRTDGEIARLMLLAAGVSADQIDDRAAAVREQTCRLFSGLCPDDLSGKVVPGMPELLGELACDDGVALALLTGNFEPVARLKLARAGIGHYFPAGQGGFGSDCEDRAGLPPIARRRAGDQGDRDGLSYPRAHTVVIGDTPRDIACARADGLRCIAVTSGPYDAGDLAEADAVARTTAELREALAAAGRVSDVTR